MSYLAKVLHDGSGTRFPDIVRLERRFHFSPVLWGHQDDLEVVNDKIILDEISEDHSPKTRPGTTEVRESGTVDHDDRSSSETIKLDKSFCGGPGGSFYKKSPLVAEGISNEKVDLQSPEVEGYQFKEGDRVPTVEIGKEAVLQKQESSGQLQPQPRPQPQKAGKAEPQKEKIQNPSNTANQETLYKPGIFVKTVEVTVPGRKTILVKNHNAPVQKKGRGRMTNYKQNTNYKLQITNTGKQNSTEKKSTNDAVVQIQESPEQLQPQSQPRPQLQKTGIAEPQKEKIQSIPGTAKQEPLPEPGIVVKTIEIPGEPAKKSENLLPPFQLQPQPKKAVVSGFPAEKTPIPATGTEQETVHEPGTFVKRVEVPVQPTSPPRPDIHLSTQSSEKREKNMDRIVNEISSIKKKLDEHIRNEHNEPEPQNPVFLPKRPASRNLGGWSDLERNASFRRC